MPPVATETRQEREPARPRCFCRNPVADLGHLGPSEEHVGAPGRDTQGYGASKLLGFWLSGFGLGLGSRLAATWLLLLLPLLLLLLLQAPPTLVSNTKHCLGSTLWHS